MTFPRHLAPLLALATACTGPGPVAGEDAGVLDAAVTDAAVRDAATPMLDAGTDASVVDSGPQDAAPPQPDASVAPDAAVDAGLATEDVVYPLGARHSPLTPAVVARLREIANSVPRQPNVLAKVGDSNTVNPGFLTCLDGPNLDLAGRDALQATVNHFAAGDAAGSSPYDRVSQAATVGWSAPAVLAGSPTPLDTEISAISPRYAVVLFGTNDIQSRAINTYANALVTMVDTLATQGVVPLLTTVPPRDDDATADAWVPRYNLVVRAVAQSRRIPLLDLEGALRPIPNHGIGPDGLHLNTYQAGGARGCVFTPAGLEYGHNTRNLLTLEALHRARSAVETGVSLDAPGAPRVGQGSWAAPFEIASLPFVDARDTRVTGERVVDVYSCSPANEGGPEVVYSLTVTSQTTVEFRVLDGPEVDVDVQLLGPADTQCVSRHDQLITATLQPGRHRFTVDTYISAGTELPGPYLLTVMQAP